MKFIFSDIEARQETRRQQQLKESKNLLHFSPR